MKITNEFDFELATEYSAYCLRCKQCNDICKKLERLSPDGEEYHKLCEQAEAAYISLLQWYNLMVGNASIAVADIKSKLQHHISRQLAEDMQTIQTELGLE